MRRGGEIVRCCNELLHNPHAGINAVQIGIGPQNYARQLARYIRDASTIRARTLSEWGRSPTLEQCRQLISDAVAERNRYRAESDRLAPKEVDAVDFVPGATDHAKRTHRLAVKLANQKFDLPAAPPANDDLAATRPLLLGELVCAVARAMKVTIEELTGPSRSSHIMQARQVVCTVLSRRGQSYSQIGDRIKRDHTTVLNALRRFETHASDRMRLVADHFTGPAKGSA